MAKVHWNKYKSGHEITVKWKRFFGILKPEIKTYVGDCTVWYDAETNKRQDTLTECQLAGIWEAAKRKHENNPSEDNIYYV